MEDTAEKRIGSFLKRLSASLLLIGILGVGEGIAQLPTATILGTVRDGTGAVVPDTSVTARNVETGQTRTANSGGNGAYRFSALPVGSYELRIAHPGFQTQIRSGLTLTVAQEAVINFTLQVGAVEQTVSVTAEAPLVETTSGSLGGLVDESRVADLPLNGRNYIDLTLLQTGVNLHSRHGETAGLTGTMFSSSGATTRSNSFLLDGASMVTLWGASSASVGHTTLGVEGVREFRVVTNGFSAEYGMTMGSQSVIVSKNGTNQFHGSLFEYLRNSALDARNFFDYQTPSDQRRLPPFTRNQFGGAIGGPIVQDRTFFHTTFEALRERLGVTTVSNTLPSRARIEGVANGGIVDAIHPRIKPVLVVFPEPNLPNSQFTFPYSQPTREDYGQARVDHNFGANDMMFARYTIDDTERVDSDDYPQWIEPRTSRAQFLTLSETHIFSPTVLSTFRASYSRTKLATDTSNSYSGPDFSWVEGQELSQLAVGSLTGFSGDNASPSHNKQNIFTVSDDVYYTRGDHSLKFGFLMNRFQQYTLLSLQTRGNISFSNVEQFLLGNIRRFTRLQPGGRQERYIEYSSLGFYAQDDWRVLPNLTLNLGLRYEFITMPTEGMNPSIGSAIRDLAVDTEATPGRALFGENPSLKNFSPRLGFAWDVGGNGMTAVRGGFGLLYDMNNHIGSSLLSAAAGTPPHSGLIARSGRVNSATGEWTYTMDECCPLQVTGGATSRDLRLFDYNIGQPHMLHYNLSVQRQMPWQTAVTLTYAGSRGLNLIQHKEGNPTTPSEIRDGRQYWTGDEERRNPAWGYLRLNTTAGNSWYNSFQFGFQKRMTEGLQFQSSYTWSKVIDTTQGVVPVDSSGDIDGVDPSNWRVDKAPAAFDILHNWRLNAIYRIPGLPTEGIVGKLLGGWWMSGIFSAQGGYPFTVDLDENRSRSQANGDGEDRPDLLPGVKTDDIISGVSRGCGVPGSSGYLAPGTPIRAPERYFDPCAFSVQPNGFLGNAGRNILRAPGRVNFDFSVGKDVPIAYLGEAGRLEFRAEFFNLLNHTNFSLPSITAFTGTSDDGEVENPLRTAGRITSTQGTSRQIQLALKLIF